MCAQLYIQRAAQPDTWVMSGAPAATTIWLSRDTPINYSDGTTDTLPANTPAVLPGGGTSFDRTHDVYVPYTVKGSGVLSIIKESLLPTLTDDYAPLARVELHGIKPYQPEPYLAAGGLGATTATTSTLPSTTAAKALSLWNGSSNNSPPSGWETTSFDDSAWAHAVIASQQGGYTPPAGASLLWTSDPPAASTQIVLLRQSVLLPSGPVTSASVVVAADDFTDACYVNGTLVPGSNPAPLSGNNTLSVPPSFLLPGAVNVVAIQARNSAPTHAWSAYELTVQTAGTGGLPNPGGTEGDLLYYHSGAWARLPVGATGDELTIVAGDPAWTAQPADSDYTDPLTTKGDLVTRSASATVRLGVGSNGQVLTADSTQTDGIKWATPTTGSVTSIDVAVPAPLSSTGGPITSSGTVTLAWASGQTANRVLASPDGTTGAVSLRALVGNDIPVDASTIVSSAGTIKGNYQAGSGVAISGNTISATGSGGSVTSVALTVPSILSVAGSPITGAGTLAVTLANETAATVFAGPTSGSAAAPTFRALQGTDLPAAAAAGGHIHAHGHFL